MSKPNCDWQKCWGEAHRPDVHGCIDNCMVCMPYWEEFPICPNCSANSVRKYKLAKPSGYCKSCKKYYAMAVPEVEE